MSKAGWLALCAGAFAMGRDNAHGDGVAQVMTAKSLPAATVAVIDPETGTSSGTSGSDVRVAVGDIILFRFAFTPVPDKINRGLGSWLTEYIPPNTEVVGVRIIDANGNTIEPSYPGIAKDGCESGACSNFNNLPCDVGGGCDFAAGSIAQLHADTGVFVTDDARLGPNPANAFITMNNGITMSPEPRNISPGIVALLNDTTAPYFAHNDWDWTQVRAYGFNGSASGNSGVGNTPFEYGSPVAGPDTFYQYEATLHGANVHFDDVVGPWERIVYPGSLIGFGAGDANGGLGRNVMETNAGTDLTPANPFPGGGTAVRVALGETRTGEPGYVEVALRVTGVPIDPTFGASGGNVDCGEVVGSDTSSRGNSGAKDNPWPTYVASPACVFLRLLFDLEVDKTLATGADNLTYTLRGKNLSVDPETNAVARMMFDQSRQSYISSDPPADRIRTCLDDSTKQCIEWDLGTLAPSDEYVLEATMDVGGGGQTTNVMLANYRSDQLPAPGFTSQALTVVTGIAVPKINLAPGNWDPTTSSRNTGTTGTLITGTITNIGTAIWSQESLTIVLPAGWTIPGATHPIVIDGVTETCDSLCTTNTPTYNLNLSYNPGGPGAAGSQRAVSFNVSIPATGTGSASPALYRIDAQTWGSQSGFGGSFETYFPKAAFVNVGQRRTVAPVVTCSVLSTSTSISGTAEANAAINVKFNLLNRGTATAAASPATAAAWTSSNFGAFGELYGGLEVRATAQVAGELESELSAPCTASGVRACADRMDNDGDGLIDFPSDPGCSGPSDNSEANPVAAQCSDGVNQGGGGTDWPNDASCDSPLDPTEDGVPSCNDNIDNDGDGRVDFDGNGTPGNADPDCSSASDGTETRYNQCQDGLDNDGDGFRDYGVLGVPAGSDPGCHSAFDDEETDTGSSTLDTQPRFLIAMDSSGSMNGTVCSDQQFTGGDGSTECAGNNVDCATCSSATCGSASDDARLYKVKAGISEAVSAFGEVEYALMRFHQRPELFACPTAAAGLQSGGWQGSYSTPDPLDPNAAPQCGSTFAAGDVVVSFAQNNEHTILDWMNGDSDYPGNTPPYGLDQEIRGSGTTPLAGMLTSAGSYMESLKSGDSRPCRPYRVILVTDGNETCGGDPAAAATLLYDAGIGVTVIGFATPDQTVISDLNAIARAGSGNLSDAIFVDDEAELSQAIAAVIASSILVERCNGADDDCDGQTDEDFPVGEVCNNGGQFACYEEGVLECLSDFEVTCTANPPSPGVETCNGQDDNCNGIVDEGLPLCNCTTQEICNGRDDDCDGQIDESTPPLPGVGDQCGLDIGECSFGSLACVGGALVCQGGQGPGIESCDMQDDDCDTFIDEYSEECYTGGSGCTLGGSCQGLCRTGVRTCNYPSGPGLGACVGEVLPDAELCNGLDDDCNGIIDDPFPGVGGSCDNGLLGICRVTGTLACTGDGTGTFCTAPQIPAGVESCNGLDDDCDGVVDDNLGSPIGLTCGGGAGCGTGTFQCVAGEVVCAGATGGSPETCDGFDNDCDMVVDNPPVPGTGTDDCIAPGFEQWADIGECDLGDTICEGGQLICTDYVGPKPEVCNGLDDDCDNMIDNQATCPGVGNTCVAGECASPCGSGEFNCPFGFQCVTIPNVGDYCLVDPCASITCAPGFSCDSATGQCFDLCSGINCGDGETCVGGLCRDCFSLGCPEGEVCVRDASNVAVCQGNPCSGVTCDSDQYCRDGGCVQLTCDPACGSNQRCLDGVCIPDYCDDVTCPGDTTCRPTDGECETDPCTNVFCPSGEDCRPSDGECVNDPCLTIVCPEGVACQIQFDGTGACYIPPPPDRDRIYAGGGGCSTSGGQASSILVGLGLALALRRRARRG